MKLSELIEVNSFQPVEKRIISVCVFENLRIDLQIDKYNVADL